MIKILFIAFLIMAMLPARSQDTATLFRHHVALKISEGPPLMRQCSRSTPAHITGFYEVGADTIAIVERNFWRLRGTFDPKRKPATHADSLAYVHHYDGNQYIGVIIAGQRYVYINHLGGDLRDCMNTACNICDGGAAFWGVLFNVSTLAFSEEAYNGVG